MATVGKDASYDKSTGQYMRMGHTKGKYGNDPGTASSNRGPAEMKP